MTRNDAQVMGERLYDLACDHADWSQERFGTDAEKGPLMPLRHLRREAADAEQAAEDRDRPGLLTELADCQLLLLDALRRSGYTLPQLIAAAQDKMVVNKAREWPSPTADMPVEHVRP